MSPSRRGHDAAETSNRGTSTGRLQSLTSLERFILDNDRDVLGHNAAKTSNLKTSSDGLQSLTSSERFLRLDNSEDELDHDAAETINHGTWSDPLQTYHESLSLNPMERFLLEDPSNVLYPRRNPRFPSLTDQIHQIDRDFHSANQAVRTTVESYQPLLSHSNDGSMASYESDSESDAGSDDSHFPPEPTLDDYLVRPREYLNHLERLRERVIQNSFAYRVLRNQEAGEDIQVVLINSDPEGKRVSAIDKAPTNDTIFWSQNAQFSISYGCLRQLSTILDRVDSNIELLRSNAFCTSNINTLVMDPARADVVHLECIKLGVIQVLTKTAHDCLGQAEDELLVGELEIALSQLNRIFHMQHFRNESDNQGIAIAKILDLSVILYCSAHIARFDTLHLNVDLNGLGIWHPSHGHANSYDKTILLKVSTYITELADIWGPIWPVSLEGLKTMTTFQAGGGVLVPGSINETHETTLDIDHEIPYHWAKDLTNLHVNLIDEQDTGFDEKQLLLIGGDCLMLPQGEPRGISAPNLTSSKPSSSETLGVNTSCTIKASKVTKKLKDAHCLRIIGTAKPRIYRDSETMTGSLGHIATFAVGVTLKRSAGVTVKDTLCSAWKLDGGTRNPAVLECWYGLEVSACSGNASRRRLKDILGSNAIRKHLCLCYPNWEKTDYGHSYSTALASEDVRAFRKLWNENLSWQGDLQRLVSCCFEALRFSEVDKNDQMSVLWMDENDHETIATIPAGLNSWTGILKDTEISCFMAILSQSCLEYLGTTSIPSAGCRNNIPRNLGFALLETALVINRKAPLPKHLSRNKPCFCGRRVCWDVNSFDPGDTFSLGNLGEIIIVDPPDVGHSRILAKWERNIGTGFRNALDIANRNILKGSPKPHHWEAMDPNDEKRRPRPIGLLLLSQGKTPAKWITG